MRAYLIILEGENNNMMSIQRLKTLGEWARITQNSYIVLSNAKASEIRNTLYADNDEIRKIFVINVTNRGWASYGLSEAVNNWIKSQVLG